MTVRKVIFAFALLFCGAASAQTGRNYPDRPITIIASQPPGGSFDMMARLVADTLQKAWGQPVIVENKSGAGGLIGVAAAAKAPADGYTLVIGSTGPFAVSPSLIRNMPFDPAKDFAPIARLAKMPSYLVVNPKVPVNNVKEFLEYVKANPGKLAYASAGNGMSQHTNVELLKSMANLFILPVTYRGSAPAMNDLLGHQVDVMIELGPQAIPQIRAGRLKVLATTSATRTEAMPEVPTLAESGVPGYEASTWFALYAPAATPPDIVEKLSAEINRAFRRVDVKSKLAAVGAEVALTGPDELKAFQASEASKWAGVIKRAGIKPE